jgi:hypothetical protein
MLVTILVCDGRTLRLDVAVRKCVLSDNQTSDSESQRTRPYAVRNHRERDIDEPRNIVPKRTRRLNAQMFSDQGPAVAKRCGVAAPHNFAFRENIMFICQTQHRTDILVDDQQ